MKALNAAVLGVLLVVVGRIGDGGSGAHPTDTTAAAYAAVVQRVCVICHNDRALTGSLSLAAFDVAKASENAETAEKMIRKLRAGMMPPPGKSCART